MSNSIVNAAETLPYEESHKQLKLYQTNKHQESPIDEKELSEMAKKARSMRNQKKWIRRMKIFFCCLGYKKNKDSIADVASIFAEFHSDLNVPASDIAAGFVLLSKYQSAQRQWIVKNNHLGVQQYLSSVPITKETRFLDISTANDSHLINDLIYYMNYSLAIFGWPMQVIDDPCMLCCIYPYLKLSPCCSRARRQPTTNKNIVEYNQKVHTPKDDKEQSSNIEDKTQVQANNNSNVQVTRDDDSSIVDKELKSNYHTEDILPIRSAEFVPGELTTDWNRPIILEDNCCGCNFASAERRLAAHNYEIIYVSYKVNVNVVPFLVAADHSKQTVVVAMRGSMSLSDMITDMNGQTDKLPIENCPDDWLCHRGITKAAIYVKATLLMEHILDRAFKSRPDLGSEGYKLLLCGHSLGAGVAAILGILLRDLYPNLKAYLYSPPGGILSLPAVEYTKQFATGIFLGNDCVPRLGVAQLERLRYQVLLGLKSSQRSTSKILAKALCPTFCLGSNKVDYDPDRSLNLLYGTEARSFDYNNSKIPFQVQPQVLYVPGRLIHVVKNTNFQSKTKRLLNGPIYQAIWNDNTYYDRIMISEGMFYDHLPNNLMHAMKMLFSKTLPARKDTALSTQVVSTQIVTTTDNSYCHQTSETSGINTNDLTYDRSTFIEQKSIVIHDNNNNDQNVIDENNNNDLEKNYELHQKLTNNLQLLDNNLYIDESPNFMESINVIDKDPLDDNGNDETMPDNNINESNKNNN